MEVRNKLIKEKNAIIKEILNPAKISIEKQKIVRVASYMSKFKQHEITNEINNKIEKLFQDAENLNINNVEDYYSFFHKELKTDFSKYDDNLTDFYSRINEQIKNNLQTQKSLTDSIQILLVLEHQTNDKMDELQMDYTNEIWKALLDKDLDTNNLLIEKINQVNNSEKYKKLNFDLKENISKLCELEYFKSDNKRFLNIKRTKENNKSYKEKDLFGFIYLTKLGIGASNPNITIKKILEPSEKISKKYSSLAIEKSGYASKKYILDELYRSELMKYISPRDYSKTRKADQKLSIKIMPDFISYKNSSVEHNDKEVVNFILLSYITKIGDRHWENISSDLRNIDFSATGQGYSFANVMAETLDDIKNPQDIKDLKEYLDRYLNEKQYTSTIKNQFHEISNESFEKYFIEFCKDLKEIVNKNKKDIEKLISECKEKTRENLLFSEKGFEFLDCEYIKNKIAESSERSI